MRGIGSGLALRFQRAAIFNSYWLLLIIVVIGLFARLHSIGFVPESLWGSDVLFINQSYELGIQSLWTRFIGFNDEVGYYFLYHRMVALIARCLPLVLTPYIFFAGWLLSFLMVVYVLKSRAEQLGMGAIAVLLIAVAITLQPSHGEAWFNLNQAHFTTGMALALYICMPTRKPPSMLDIVFLIVTSLSGISCIFLLPVLALQLLVLKDFRTRRSLYILVPICAAIEAALLFGSGRVGAGGSNVNISDWLSALRSFFLFGAENWLVDLFAILFWLLTIFGFVSWLQSDRRRADRHLWLAPLLALLAAALMFLGAAMIMGGWLARLSPLDMASRYLLIPYALVFFAAVICNSDSRQRLTAMGCLILAICILTFRTVDRPDRASSTGLLEHRNLQWLAHAKLHELRPDAFIPVNPDWPMYPPLCRVEVPGPASHVTEDLSRRTVTLHPQRAHFMRHDDRDWVIDAGETNTMLEFAIGEHCLGHDYLALEVDAWRSKSGDATLYWKDVGSPDRDEGSLVRFYPAGEITMQFAFRRAEQDDTLWLYPSAGVVNSTVVQEFARMSLPYVKHGKVTSIVARATPPGGEIRIRSVRLICLDD